jgi:hypothetical protein
VSRPTRNETATALWAATSQEYDRSPALTSAEEEALTMLGTGVKWWRRHREVAWRDIQSLVKPLQNLRDSLNTRAKRATYCADMAVAYLLHSCLREGGAYWAWDLPTWARVCGRTERDFLDVAPEWVHDWGRQYVIALAYMIGDFGEPLPLDGVNRIHVAEIMFGETPIRKAMTRVDDAAAALGYRAAQGADANKLRSAVCEALMVVRSPDLNALSRTALERLRCATTLKARRRADVYRLHRALASIGVVEPSVWNPPQPLVHGADTPPAWREAVERWYATSTLAGSTRQTSRSVLLQVGRWLAAEHPHVRSPSDWTREHCAVFLAHVDQWQVGAHVSEEDQPSAHARGHPPHRRGASRS